MQWFFSPYYRNATIKFLNKETNELFVFPRFVVGKKYMIILG